MIKGTTITISKSIYYKELLHICLSNNIPFVSYSLPKQNEIITLIQYNSLPQKISVENYEFDTNGFIIAPFNESANNFAYFVDPDLRLNSNNINEEILEFLKNVHFDSKATNFIEDETYIDSQLEFTQNVEKIKNTISQGIVEKVVLSRIHKVNCHSETDLAELFLDINHSYPDAFTYIFQLPETGCWLGATPEPLILVKNNIAETVSLAATKKLNGIPVENIEWTTKEKNEQNQVTKYIEALLSRFEISEYTENSPIPQQAGQLIHLKSVFKFDSKKLGIRKGSFINSLHPTPSVCGFPKELSMQLIFGLEKHKREYYTGFLGPVNLNGEINLYVNIRCMKRIGSSFLLYQGAGITEGSDPLSEWNETEQKMMTMLSVLRKYCVCV